MRGAALVTGGQRGIGLGIARALAAEGFDLVLVGHVPEDAPEVAEALAALPEGTRYHAHDVAAVEGHAALVARVEAETGPITALVSNAGIPARRRGDMLDVAPEDFDAVMGVNLRGGFFLAQAVARRMLAAGAGPYRSITFVTSVSAAMASVERAEYCVSKAGASMAARLFAARLAPHGIGVFEVRPGIVATGMTEGVRDRYDAAIAGGLVPMGRWGTPADVGAVVAPLARGEMAFATGSVVGADGGLAIPRL